jgi:hypothetical protein
MQVEISTSPVVDKDSGFTIGEVSEMRKVGDA